MIEYHGCKIDVVGRRLSDGGTCFDAYVYSPTFEAMWSHQLTDYETAILTAKHWIDGKDRSVGVWDRNFVPELL